MDLVKRTKCSSSHTTSVGDRRNVQRIMFLSACPARFPMKWTARGFQARTLYAASTT
jgi:hypothetical protein